MIKRAVVLVTLLVGATAGMAQQCESEKLKLTGKHGVCRMKALTRALKKGTVADFTKCDFKFGRKWAKIEDRYGEACPVIGDLVTVQEKSSECTVSLAGEIGGIVPVRFVDNADGTITDNLTGLMWEKKIELDGGANSSNPHDADNLYVWAGVCSIATGKRCQPTAAAAALCNAHVEGAPEGCDECIGGDGTCTASETIWSWAAALNDTAFAGYADWRIPTVHELQSIVDYTSDSPPTINVAFHGYGCGVGCAYLADPSCSCSESDAYATASTYCFDSSLSWSIDFFEGFIWRESKSQTVAVRAVRGD